LVSTTKKALKVNKLVLIKSINLNMNVQEKMSYPKTLTSTAAGIFIKDASFV
jgi:hypothetical protein